MPNDRTRTHREIHVGERPTFEHIACKHLADWLDIELEPSDPKLRAEEDHTQRG